MTHKRNLKQDKQLCIFICVCDLGSKELQQRAPRNVTPVVTGVAVSLSVVLNSTSGPMRANADHSIFPN